jgi:hypothetical protein
MTAPRYRPYLRATGVLLLIVFVCTGITLGAKSFASNLLADGIGTLLALLFIERIVDADRKRRWSLVSGATLETLRDAMIRSSLSAYLLLEAPRPPQADPLMMAESGHLSHALRELSARLTEWSLIPPLGLEIESAAHRILEPTAEIFQVVLPRLLLVGTQPALVELLVRVEHAAHRLAYDVSLEERFGFPPGKFLTDVADLVDAFSVLAESVTIQEGR